MAGGGGGGVRGGGGGAHGAPPTAAQIEAQLEEAALPPEDIAEAFQRAARARAAAGGGCGGECKGHEHPRGAVPPQQPHGEPRGR